MLTPAARDTIGRFAAAMDLAPAMAEDGSFSFAFERSGVLTFTGLPIDDRVAISLARPSQGHASARRAAFLALAGHDAAAGRCLHAGLTLDGDLVASMVLDAGDFTLDQVEEAFAALARMHETAK